MLRYILHMRCAPGDGALENIPEVDSMPRPAPSPFPRVDPTNAAHRFIIIIAGADPGFPAPPTRALFGENLSENERIMIRSGGVRQKILYVDPPMYRFLTIAARARLAVTPGVIKSYYANVERQHDQIKSSVAEYMSKFKVFH